ncbi:serine/threonine protein kinase [Candidatus Uabimicrobium amorphum]|uniref:Serine/threonine protein kinase n=1 Tax=Uabimicrobium amorphum TaxID=2596890 RepID=A0A5S9F7X4_UABAM|nr:serine/threonine-protein kinase [Candidatus Uabimicrobium amorphum]BBM88114.1 serine/threonine protein kinase [Candidatus Uabimicrobium amorphum]
MDIDKKWKALIGLDNENATATYKGSGSLPEETLATLMGTVGSDKTVKQNIHVPSTNYTLSSKIAQGGMGIVFRGRQTNLQRDIAIKQSISTDKNREGKFIAESVMTAYLNHPNIVPVHDLGRNEDGHVFLAMKLVGGVEWKEIIYTQDTDKKYSLEKHLKILLNVCNAVAFAHSKNIVHNDLKPSNVMIGEFGEVLVMDWGIAVDIAAKPRTNMLHKSHVESPMGTPAYIPYELANGQGEDIGPWTDTYLLGGILYEILMKQPPHRGNPLEAIMSCSLGKAPSYDESIPLELRNICNKALSRDIKERYPNVAEFKHAIENFLQHRESLILTEKADHILDEITTYLEEQKQGRLLLAKLKYIFFDIPGRMLFPFFWYYSNMLGKCIFAIYIALFSFYSFYFEDESLLLSVLVGIPCLFIVSNVVFVLWQFIKAVCFKKEIGVLPSRLNAMNRNYLYANLIKAITLYERSIEIWSGNEHATEKKRYAHAKFADIALQCKDSGLAETHLQVLKGIEDPYVAEIRDRLIRVKVEEKSDRTALAMSKFLMAAIVYICVFFVIVFLIFWEYIMQMSSFSTNENEAIALLQSYATKQQIFRAEVHCDQNNNDRGEYGFLQELAGVTAIRGKQHSLAPRLIAEEKQRFFTNKNYYFYCYLPGENEVMTEDDVQTLKSDSAIITDQERRFVIYAWPKERGKTGHRAFAVNESGFILATKEHSYSGDKIPKANAAYNENSAPTNKLEGTWCVGVGADGNNWKHVVLNKDDDYSD